MKRLNAARSTTCLLQQSARFCLRRMLSPAAMSTTSPQTKNILKKTSVKGCLREIDPKRKTEALRQELRLLSELPLVVAKTDVRGHSMTQDPQSLGPGTWSPRVRGSQGLSKTRPEPFWSEYGDSLELQTIANTFFWVSTAIVWVPN